VRPAGAGDAVLAAAIGRDLPWVREFLAHINVPTMLAAALLVLAVIVVIVIGKALLMAAIFGAVAGGVSLGQGNEPSTAGTHAAIGFGVAAVILLLVRSTRSLFRWLLITAAGVAALLFWGMGTS
jgi:hypothetical protein